MVKSAHPVDAYIVRQVRRAFINAGIPCLTILDSYAIPPRFKKELVGIIYQSLNDMEGWMHSNMQRIQRETGVVWDNPFDKRSVDIIPSGLIV